MSNEQVKKELQLKPVDESMSRRRLIAGGALLAGAMVACKQESASGTKMSGPNLIPGPNATASNAYASPAKMYGSTRQTSQFEHLNGDANFPATRIFHFNINVRNLEISQSFYEMLGFKPVDGFGDGQPGTSDIMSRIYGAQHIRGARGNATTLKFRHMRIGDGPLATRVDMVEWVDPAPHGAPISDLTQLGIARMSLHTVNIQGQYRRLQAEGVKFLVDGQGPMEFPQAGSGIWILPFFDPSGNIIQLLEGIA